MVVRAIQSLRRFTAPFLRLSGRFAPFAFLPSPQSCSHKVAAAIVVLLAVPSLTTLTGVKILNPLYQCLVVSVAFPAIVWFGARGLVDGKFRSAVGFVGRLSYPLYAVHYPLIYLYIHWLMIGAQPFGPLPWATPVCLFFIAIFLGVVSLLCYDEPLRRWLSRKVQKGSAEKAHQG